ncbi:MAG: hypothetical protein MUF18_07570 [Fimbriiglobus sp.]|nr:hypothetical protein [Fimbriiglobus sp.]
MTFDWPALLARPVYADFPAWFDRVAHQLLFGCRLVANGVPMRLIEVEAYYHGPGHEDTFAHRDPVQLTPGRWYFHRTGGQYRGGSFKGLDLTFGDRAANAFGGFLIRGVELPDGSVIDGPSLTVDHLLKVTDQRTVAELDTTIRERPAWIVDSPLVLVEVPGKVWGTGRAVTRGFRVGLSLKKRRYTADDPAFAYLFCPYRFLSEPTQTKKGKPHMVLPLIAAGKTPAEITSTTNCPPATVIRYAADFAAGKLMPSVEEFYGKEMSTADLCKLYGLWWVKFGAH